MTQLFTNNASTTITNAPLLTSATTINLSAGSGAKFPSPSGGDYFMGTLIDSSGNVEIVQCTGRSVDALTVVRAQEGTSALSFVSGSTFALRATAGLMSRIGKASRFPPNNKMAWVGDSIIYLTVNAANDATHTRNSNRGQSFWTSFLTRQKIDNNQAYNFGVNGDTSTGVLGRMGPILAAQAGIYYLCIGCNDVYGSFAYATTQANILNIVTQLLANDPAPIVILSTIVPIYMTGSMLLQVWRINKWIKSLTGLFDGLYVVDPGWRYVNPQSTTSVPNTHMAQGDNIHPSAMGAYALSIPVINFLNNILPDTGEECACVTDVYDATYNPTGNLLPSGVSPFTGTSGTVGGTGLSGTCVNNMYAETYSASGTAFNSAAIVGSTVTDSDGKVWQEFSLGGTLADDSGSVLYLQLTMYSFTNFSIGDRVYSTVDIQIDPGTTGIGGIECVLDSTESGTAYEWTDGLTFLETFPTFTTMQDGVLKTPIRTLLAVPTAFQWNCRVWGRNLGTGPYALAGKIRIAAPKIMKA